MPICPTVFLKMKRECPLVQGKCNKIVTGAMPPFHHSKNKNSENSINFFSHWQLQYKLCDLISDYYFVTLPIHSHAKVKIVTRYMRQSVSCDILGQRSPNYAPPDKSGTRRHFVNNEKIFY